MLMHGAIEATNKWTSQLTQVSGKVMGFVSFRPLFSITYLVINTGISSGKQATWRDKKFLFSIETKFT